MHRSRRRARLGGDGELERATLRQTRLLGFGSAMMGCIAGRADYGRRGILLGVLTAQVYASYSRLLWPLLMRSTAPQLGAHRDWAKCEREAPAAPAVDQVAG